MTDRKPPELFPGCKWEHEPPAEHEKASTWGYQVIYSAQIGPTEYALADARYENSTWQCFVGTDWAVPGAEDRPDAEFRKSEHGDDGAMLLALDWLRARILAHRDELCRVTGTMAKEMDR